MKAIYTRTIGVYDEKLGEAMEISKGLAKVRKKHYPDHEVYFSFQIGGNPVSYTHLTLPTIYSV